MNDLMYCDRGKYKTWTGKTSTREYGLWNRIRYCCYGNHPKKNLSYKGCSIAPEFYSFQAFAEWVNGQIGFKEGFQLDKDLLVKGNRIYAPDRCVFLPLELNSILIRNSHKRGNLPIGVTLNPYNKTKTDYWASIKKGKKNYRIGLYSTVEEAFFAYKKAKEAEIKEVAQKYKGIIDPRAYAALMNYTVEITD